MKKLNLQLGSIKEVLTKEQMKKVTGGYGDSTKCVKRFRANSTSTWQEANFYHADSMSCSDQSSFMNQSCVNFIEEYPDAECTYDCGCDGWGY